MAQNNVADSEDISSDKIILLLYEALEIQPFQIRCGETIEKALEKKTDEEIRQMLFELTGKVIHPKYYKHLKKGAHQSHLGRQKMDRFLLIK